MYPLLWWLLSQCRRELVPLLTALCRITGRVELEAPERKLRQVE